MFRGRLPRALPHVVVAATIAVVGIAVGSSGAAAGAPTAAAHSASAAAKASASAAAKSASAVAKAYAVHAGRSPSAPNPHPPLGGIAPDGQDVGGAALRERGFVLPAHAPKLPAHLTARAWMVTDLDTGAVLAARDPHGRYQPASVLKLLAGLVMLPHLTGSRVITATAQAANAEGSAVGLVPGGRYTVNTLFDSLYLMSGNDAATALAQANGGDGHTVAEMNTEAHRLGAYDTVVQTPSGLDGWTQLTSAYDLTLILRAAVNTPRLVAYDQTRTARLPAQKVGKRKWKGVPLFNESDDFLDTVPGALFVKTGYTGAAQHTYACAASRDGRRIGVVFLRNQRRPLDQYQQAAALLAWAYALPPTTAPVGHLEGPVTRSGASTTTSRSSVPGPTTPASDGAHPAARPTPNPHADGTHPITRWYTSRGLLLAVVALGVVSFLARLYRRRRRGLRGPAVRRPTPRRRR